MQRGREKSNQRFLPIKLMNNPFLKNINRNNVVVNNNVYIFAPTEPDKPLNNAQMVGSSIFIRLGNLKNVTL